MANTTSGNQVVGWRQVLRPLFWWLLLMLILSGIRTHQYLMEQTRLNFTVTLGGQPLDVAALLDQKSFASGGNISLGSHTFTISLPKTEPFTTNFFAGYGKHDLGEIKLQRGMGTLTVQAHPPATAIIITGPKFSITLTNSSGTNVTVPTDAYNIRAEYPHGSQSRDVAVSDHQAAMCGFAPTFGSLYVASNQGEVTYRLQSAAGEMAGSGNLPVLLNDLPTGNYQLTASYHHWKIEKSLTVAAGATNDLPIEFVFGALHLTTEPPGVAVIVTGGNYWGVTPLDLPEVPPQTAHLNLSLAGYEPVSVTLEIIANQTTSFRTNLIGTGYLPAMREARQALAATNYQWMAQAAATALNAKPNDADALALQSEADQHLAVDRERVAQLKRPREVFDALCQQNPDASLFAEHQLTSDKPAKDMADAIAKALSSEPHPFEVLYNDLSQPDTYKIMVRQTFSLGILGGTERVGLIAVGQTKPGETKIFFKVLEYQIKTVMAGNGLLNLKESKQMIPISPNQVQTTPALDNQIKAGVRLVAEKIQSAIGQAQ